MDQVHKWLDSTLSAVGKAGRSKTDDDDDDVTQGPGVGPVVEKGEGPRDTPREGDPAEAVRPETVGVKTREPNSHRD